MRADDKRDLLFALVAGEGLVNLMCAWALVLLAAHGARDARYTGPAIVFLISAVLIVVTCAVADRVQSCPAAESHGTQSSQRQ